MLLRSMQGLAILAALHLAAPHSHALMPTMHASLRHLAQTDGSTGSLNLTGTAGNDTLVGGPSNDTIFGGAGNDTIQGEPPFCLLLFVFTIACRPTSGARTFFCATRAIVGALRLPAPACMSDAASEAPEGATPLAHGTSPLAGDSGNDILSGGPGADIITGGPGDDVIDVGVPASADDIAGGPGTDTITYDGEEVCAEPCIPDDDELLHRHPSCVVTDCVYRGGTATCIVVGPIACAVEAAPSAAPDPAAGGFPAGAPAGAPEAAPVACSEELVYTCCQGGSLGTCTSEGECLVPLEGAEECSVAEERNALAPGSAVAEDAEEISACSGDMDALLRWVIGGVASLALAVVVDL